MRIATSASHSTPLQIVEIHSRPLRRGEIRVRVHAIGVNPVDWKMREGGVLGILQRLLGPSGPLVIGVDFAGEVIEVGPGGGSLPVGARVVGGTNFARGQLGSYADEVIARPDQCAVLPDGVSYDAAACLPVAAITPWQSFTEHKLVGKGSKVLVLGASGGVGIFALQIVRMLGGTAVGVCSTRNLSVVERYGGVPIDYTLGDALEAARAHGPYDVVFHAVGTATYPLGQCRSLLAKGGLVDLVVVRPADYLAVLFLPSVTTILGRASTARLDPLVAGLASGELEPSIEATFPLEEAEAAHERSRSGKVVGKLLLKP